MKLTNGTDLSPFLMRTLWAGQTEDPFTIMCWPWELLVTRQSISKEANKNCCFPRVLSLAQQPASFVFSNPKERFLYYNLAFCTCLSFKIHNILQQMPSKQGMLVQGSSSETRQRDSPISSTKVFPLEFYLVVSLHFWYIPLRQTCNTGLVKQCFTVLQQKTTNNSKSFH